MAVKHNWLLWLECVLIFIVVPVIFSSNWFEVSFLTIPLIIITIPVLAWLIRRHGLSKSVFWVEDRSREAKYIPVVLIRFSLTATLLVLVVILFYKEQLFDLPTKHLEYWLIFMIVYPLFSVYPQELLYRLFFFERYKSIIRNEKILIIINATLFGWMHIVFGNLIAVLYTFIGGMFFARTYQVTRSLRLVCVEHALYGIVLFTIGHSRNLMTGPLLEQILS